jgi:hypothetical protein
MGRSAIPLALHELINPTSPETQVEALRELKNEIVGHDQRKELAVRHGVVKPLASILKAEARKEGKRRRGGGGMATNGAHAGHVRDSVEGSRGLQGNGEEDLRLQATHVVGSLANGELVSRRAGGFT